MSSGNVFLSPGNELRLLEGAVALFPALIAAVDAAQLEVMLETYIFDFTGEGEEVLAALERAAQRGVDVRVTVDGVGTHALTPDQLRRIEHAGVAWRVFAPLGALGLLVPSRWRRLHRKLVVVDGYIAFCGGINILDDFHDPNHGPLDAPRLDYAVSVLGPVVAQVHEAMDQAWLRMQALQRLRKRQLTDALASYRASRRTSVREAPAPSTEKGRAALVLRDNFRNRNRIEKAYLQAIGGSRKEILIANAYFLPGRKMRKALSTAARRGVKVQILLQGRYEYFMQFYASRSVYAELLAAGVQIYEYQASFLHAKVAVIDGHWATVGSSNLDPLSLLMAREANVVIDDTAFADKLHACITHALAHSSKGVDAEALGTRSLRERVRERLALGLMRLALLLTRNRY